MSCRNVILYPHGHQRAKGNYISLFLSYDQFLKRTFFVNVFLRVRNQRTDSHVEEVGEFICNPKLFDFFLIFILMIPILFLDFSCKPNV